MLVLNFVFTCAFFYLTFYTVPKFLSKATVKLFPNFFMEPVIAVGNGFRERINGSIEENCGISFRRGAVSFLTYFVIFFFTWLIFSFISNTVMLGFLLGDLMDVAIDNLTLLGLISLFFGLIASLFMHGFLRSFLIIVLFVTFFGVFMAFLYGLIYVDKKHEMFRHLGVWHWVCLGVLVGVVSLVSPPEVGSTIFQVIGHVVSRFNLGSLLIAPAMAAGVVVPVVTVKIIISTMTGVDITPSTSFKKLIEKEEESEEEE